MKEKDWDSMNDREQGRLEEVQRRFMIKLLILFFSGMTAQNNNKYLRVIMEWQTRKKSFTRMEKAVNAVASFASATFIFAVNTLD